MACGLPCVATDVGGNAELVEHGRTGFVVPPEDPEGLANAILYLLENRCEAREMGAGGRTVVEQRFTTESMIGNLEKRYEHLLLGRRPAWRR
jgi:glycosyltransferase involved in cell wall biosynthesis